MIRDENINLWDVSPDGRMIAYTYWQDGAKNESVAVADIDSRQIRYKFDVSPKEVLRWTRDGRQLIYQAVNPQNISQSIYGRLNVTSAGSSPVPVKSDLIDYAVDQSPDGDEFAYIRGREMENVVMLSAN
jgi:dipeptidyl aminopeptidase/acylaminoacyl peptidase